MADDPRMAEDAQEVERLKRRLRKKLRQIENLELLERELNREELDKVQKTSLMVQGKLNLILTDIGAKES